MVPTQEAPAPPPAAVEQLAAMGFAEPVVRKVSDGRGLPSMRCIAHMAALAM